jgi:hypothetical protein
VSTIACSAASSIGLSADSCCLWYDESPASHKSDGNDVELSFHFRHSYFPILITLSPFFRFIRSTESVVIITRDVTHESNSAAANCKVVF